VADGGMINKHLKRYGVTPPPRRIKLTLAPEFIYMPSAGTPMPSRWYRFWQWFFLGWVWKYEN